MICFARAISLSVVLIGTSGACFQAWSNPAATLTGRVTNSAGDILAGAQVEATNIDTNSIFRGKTNEQGLYRILNLPPGSYRIIVRMFGFRTIVKPGVRLHVQDVIALNFSMQIGSVIASVTEEEGVPLIQAETAAQSTTVNQLAITELPSLTRNPYDFVGLSAGAVPASVSRGIGFAINGQRAESGNFLLDGSDNNEAYDSGPGQIVPLDVVQEYRLLTNNYTAEYGRNIGFVANVVTKSGTNELHGVAHYFNRNSKLAANTFENNARGISRPDFNRHQLGGAIGGPVFRDKLFFFAAFEPILVRSLATLSYYVPTPQLLAISSAGTNALFDRFPLPSQLSSTDVSIRTVCPYGRGCGSKISTGFVTIPAFASTSRKGPVDAGAGPPQDTYLGTMRLDYNVSERLRINARYALQNMNQFAVVSQPYSPDLDQSIFARNQNFSLNLTRFWPGNFFTESRLVYSRWLRERPTAPQIQFPSFAITGDAISGATRSLSLPSGKNGDGGPQNTYQFYQAANWIKGKHNLKFGWQYVHLRDNQIPTEVAVTLNNQGEFRDLQSFVDGQLSSYQIALDPKGRLPGELIAPPFGPFSTKRHYRSNDMAGFFQDAWKISSRLTLSPGIRYEYFGQEHRVGHERPLDASFYNGSGNSFEQIANGKLLRTVDAPGAYKNHYFVPQTGNFGPRMGLAYDLTGDGKSILRAGTGLFFERLPGLAFENLNPPSFSITRLTNVSITPALFDNPYTLFPNDVMPVPPSTVTYFDQNLKTAYAVDWNLTIEHEMSHSLLLAASYMGSKGDRLYRRINTNRIGSGQFVGRSGERLFNTASGFVTVNNQADSSFEGLQLRAESLKVRNWGLQFGVNYTWSHSIDNVSSLMGDDPASGATGLPLDAFDPWLDRGPSDHDVRHRWVSHFVWQIPLATTSVGHKKHLLIGGWEISGILSFQTGQPFSLRDNQVADRDVADNTRPRVTGTLPKVLEGDAIVSDARAPNAFLVLPLNLVRDADGSCISDAAPLACQFSVNGPFEGALGRNTFRRPGTFFQNFAFIKNFDLPSIGGREGMKLQWRAEFYNLVNHSNLYLKTDTENIAAPTFNTQLGQTVPGVVASFGTPDRAPQEARQIVVALKFIF
jgi:hypothetical protein